MKIIALFSLLICASLSWAAFADEQHPLRTKFSSMEEKCKNMGERHGLSEAKMAAWMERCMTMTKLPKDNIDSKGMNTDAMGGVNRLHLLAGDIDTARAAFNNKEYTKSFNLFYPLALSDNREAQDMAGMMLILGVGTDIDFAKGTLLLSLAESNGVEGSGDMRQDLTKKWKKQILESLSKHP